jgi:hypothetical protein
VKKEPCGDCGSETYVCEPDCQWGPPSACEQGECEPGQTQTLPCGACGTTTEVCGADCNWIGDAACEGEGVCSPGTTEQRDCLCNADVETRTCRNDCTWERWSGCPSIGPLCESDQQCQEGCGIQICDPVCGLLPCSAPCHCVDPNGGGNAVYCPGESWDMWNACGAGQISQATCFAVGRQCQILLECPF